MSTKRNGSKKITSNLIVISAPSGAGKTTICDGLLKQDKQLTRSISATTRLPRGREQEGKDYFFISEKKFKRSIALNQFVEWAKVHNHYYGTLKKEITSKARAGLDVLLNIDVQGGLAVKRQLPHALLVFISPPSMTTLQKRLKDRGTDEQKTINERLKNARFEMKQSKHYDYLVVNDRLDQAIADVQAIIQAARLKLLK